MVIDEMMTKERNEQLLYESLIKIVGDNNDDNAV